MSGYFPKAEFGADQRRYMEQVSSPFATKAAKIRALDAAGYNRKDIAGFLGIRYQHARNVLVNRPSGVGSGTQARIVPPDAQGDAPGERPSFGLFAVDDRGCVALPAELLAALDARPGSSIPWRFEDGELKVMNRDAGIQFAQSLIATMVGERERRWSDDFIAERRAEAAREQLERPDA